RLGADRGRLVQALVRVALRADLLGGFCGMDARRVARKAVDARKADVLAVALGLGRGRPPRLRCRVAVRAGRRIDLTVRRRTTRTSESLQGQLQPQAHGRRVALLTLELCVTGGVPRLAA